MRAGLKLLEIWRRWKSRFVFPERLQAGQSVYSVRKQHTKLVLNRMPHCNKIRLTAVHMQRKRTVIHQSKYKRSNKSPCRYPNIWQQQILRQSCPGWLSRMNRMHASGCKSRNHTTAFGRFPEVTHDATGLNFASFTAKFLAGVGREISQQLCGQERTRSSKRRKNSEAVEI